jgi:pSer/pThr/pTyr-binding forkhead associated (FHA) protein
MLAKEAAGTDSTMTFDASELQGEEGGQALPELEGPALVVRSGGGRAGESFHPQGERTQIGRSPECEIFLDDVTVSRKHAVLVNEGGRFFIEDQGSLNGTFLNRKRIERAEISNGDEVQIGKYRLTFLAQ